VRITNLKLAHGQGTDVYPALRPDEIDSDQDAANDSDDDIVLPAGPPPGLTLGKNDELVDDDEDIPMPDDPPPAMGSIMSGTL
jgi:hypothetical protein